MNICLQSFLCYRFLKKIWDVEICLYVIIVIILSDKPINKNKNKIISLVSQNMQKLHSSYTLSMKNNWTPLQTMISAILIHVMASDVK